MNSTVTPREAREALLASIARRDPLIVLTGEPRSGKTTLCRSVIETDGTAAAWVAGRAALTFHEILQQAAADLQAGANPPATAEDLALAASEQDLIALIARAVDTNPRRSAAIVVDDAHVLRRFVIGKMQTLVDLSTAERGLTVVLAGQPELERTIDRPDCLDLRQHINTRLRLRSSSEPHVSARKDIIPAWTRAAMRPARLIAAVAGLALAVGIGWAAHAIARRLPSLRAPIAATSSSGPRTAVPAEQQSQPRKQPAAAPPAAPPVASAPPAAPVSAAPPPADAGMPSTPEMDAKLERLHQTMEREAIDMAGRGDANALVNLRARTEAAYAQIGARRPDFLAALLGELDGYLKQAREARRP